MTNERIMLNRYKFQLPNGKVVVAEGEEFIDALMEVCDFIGLKALGQYEKGVPLPPNVVRFKNKEDYVRN